MEGSFLYLQGTLQGRSTVKKGVCPRRDYDALVRVARNGHGTGRVGEGWVYGVLKMELRFEVRMEDRKVMDT